MELKMNEYQLPQNISFNFEELKVELTEKVKLYETMVYTDDQIQEAKKDKATLNKLKKALNDERIRREKEYMAPFNTFKAQINEIIGVIDKPVAVIDKQVKAYEDQKKQEKKEKIKELWVSLNAPDGLTFDDVFQEKFLNTSYSMKVIKQYFEDDIKRFTRDMETLAALPEFGYEAKMVYLSTHDINKALAEGQRMAQVQKQKAEYEAAQARKREEEAARKAAEEARKQQAEQAAAAAGETAFNNAPDVSAQIPAEPAKQWVSFQALLSTEDALALKAFFEERNIEFKPV